MGDVIGVAGALAVILLGLALFVVVTTLRCKRTVEAAGYLRMETLDETIDELTRALFELAPVEIHQKEESCGKAGSYSC